MMTAPQLDLTHRRHEAEWLDGANIDPRELEEVLRGLAKFNGAFLGHYPILRCLRRAIKSTPRGTSLTVFDVGCGYGDLLRAIRRLPRRYSAELNLVGIDSNPETIRIARAATNPADWEERIAAAGISPKEAKIRWFFYRFLIERLR